MTMMFALLAFAATAAQSADFLREERTELLEFTYGWPAQVDALPRLRALLRQDMERAHGEAVATARETRAARGGNYNIQFFSKVWERAGSTPQLLSLTATTGSYTGGAHPNTTYGALLWDADGDRATEITVLLGAAALERLGRRYCHLLDEERGRRREAPVVADPNDQFSICPPIAEQVLAPADKDGNGRFDTLEALLAPYVAGPYVEGDYLIEVPFEPEDLAGLPDAYRAAFETPGERVRALPAD